MLKTQKINSEDMCYYQSNQHLPITLLLIHGNTGSSGHWKEVYPLLTDFHIVSVDLRGFGKSSTKKSISTLDPFADDIIKLCEIKKLNKIIINGWSMGGLIAMKVAEIKPDLVDKIILTNSVGHNGLHFRDSKGNQISDEDYLSNQKVKIYQNAISSKNVQLLKFIYQSLIFPYCTNISEERKQEIIQIGFEMRNSFLDTALLLVKSRIDISKISAKWLIVVGIMDAVVPYYNIEPTIEQLGRLGKNLTIAKLMGSGHMSPIEIPEKYCKILKDFILQKK